MELDNALGFAVILAWEDLMKVTEACSVRVEYRGESGTSLDYVSVWSANGRGDLDLVCDYWTWTSSAHPGGVRFSNGHYSDQLAQTLDFIMKNQDQFTRRADACRDGLVLIYPPAGDERAEAATWMRGVHGTATNFGGAADERVLPLPMPSMANRTLIVDRRIVHYCTTAWRKLHVSCARGGPGRHLQTERRSQWQTKSKRGPF